MLFYPSSAAAHPTGRRAHPDYLKEMAEWTGLEPATPGVTGRYSNQLNYHSACWWVLRGSNPRPSPCKGDALPAELSTPLEEAPKSTRRHHRWLVGVHLALAPGRLAAALLAFDGRCRFGFGDRQRRRHVGQRHLQHVVDPLDRADIEFFLHLVRDPRQFLGVAVGNEHGACV